ncbi:synaptic vesicle glycoprotein 2B isoform X1 [Neodiprion lecontei]|uniref:Synaptic vesicle glycoprotein 2B isoform X1 n=2 Tax=Neodiprion lecontei TaxID=441921 RepID=A0A6J0BTE0_NEOLC|nr:synaptic vesicle glycoprotein 2B isoform X1 [Neodiprion lecontei]XP_046590104.1 synaptic vesicle glycoprotein 2B isoform X1 [Neodiprion lecontei]XP_046590105.1 synaptic vesicle glycoprotein 2B isoform X1 [Neodiprion lecontei]XP_046590106.1 synaptic vesicle glycoprotein 2B isoform X1 [Neodiprion lecontei]
MNINGQRFGVSVALERLSDNLDSDEECDSECEGLERADFETAMTATGYGKYNYLLMLAMFLPSWGSIFDVSNMSMILPSAECDLGLALIHKGVLNAITYAGTISTAMVWGFVSDVYGRKKLLIYGYLADSLCNVMSGVFSQNFWVLLVFKFASGCIMNGPYAISMCYCAEFHGEKHRSRAMLFLGLFSTVGNIAVPLLAWSVIPHTWEIVLLDGLFVYNSWRLFLTLCGLPTLVGFMAIIFFPESPKFLMSRGQNDEALLVFRKMYTMNTGKPPETYPVISLENEKNIYGSRKSMQQSMSSDSLDGWRGVLKGFSEGLKQMKPLFLMPHLVKLLLVVSIQFGGMLALNTIRLWLPQLFTIIENFDDIGYDDTKGPPTFCEMLDISMIAEANKTSLNSTTIDPRHCENMVVDKSVYINIVVICIVSTVFFIFMSAVVNILGQKNILLICYGVSMICAVSLNWSANTMLTLFLSCLFVALTNISVNALIAVTVDLFPTTLRTMSVSLIMMIGRCGSLIGNLLFSVLLLHGCVAPLMSIAGLLLVCVLLTLFIPKPAGGLK